jgi:DNA-binding response OmpR family regulator
MRILLVEDDRLLGEGICDALRSAGYTVDWLTNGREALAALSDDMPRTARHRHPLSAPHMFG